MIRLALTAILILAGLVPFYESYADPLKEEYELQERCGKRAEEVFKSGYGSTGITNTKEGQAIAGYRNHYNKKLNKCFFLLTYRDIPYKKKQAGSVLISLYDINENREYGSFFKRDTDSHPTECTVSGKACHSEQEWVALVSPYMDE